MGDNTPCCVRPVLFVFVLAGLIPASLIVTHSPTYTALGDRTLRGCFILQPYHCFFFFFPLQPFILLLICRTLLVQRMQLYSNTVKPIYERCHRPKLRISTITWQQKMLCLIFILHCQSLKTDFNVKKWTHALYYTIIHIWIHYYFTLWKHVTSYCL